MPTQYEKFVNATIKVTQSLIGSSADDGAAIAGLSEVLQNTIFDLPGPRQLDGPNFSPLQTFQGKLFWGFLEIDKSFQALKDIEIYVGRFPYKGAVSRPNHLRYHVENHLHEIYVLRERLIKYTKIVRRAYRSDPTAEEIRSGLEDLEDLIERTLAGIVEVRGGHVHRTRFNDKDLDRLDTLDLMTQHEIIPADVSDDFRAYYLQEYRKIRKKWRATVRGNIAVIDKLLNFVGEVFLATVYSAADNNLRPPANL